MKARSSVRWVLVVGYGTTAALAILLGYVFTRDPQEPAARPAVDAPKREAISATVARPIRRRPESASTESNDFHPFVLREAPLSQEEAMLAEIQTMLMVTSRISKESTPEHMSDDDIALEKQAEIEIEEEIEELQTLLGTQGARDSDFDPEAIRRSHELRKTNLAPAYEEDLFIGLRVGALPREHFLATAGVQQGDLITAINGRKAKGGSQLLMMEELTSENGVELTVIDAQGYESTYFTQ